MGRAGRCAHNAVRSEICEDVTLTSRFLAPRARACAAACGAPGSPFASALSAPGNRKRHPGPVPRRRRRPRRSNQGRRSFSQRGHRIGCANPLQRMPAHRRRSDPYLVNLNSRASSNPARAAAGPVRAFVALLPQSRRGIASSSQRAGVAPIVAAAPGRGHRRMWPRMIPAAPGINLREVRCRLAENWRDRGYIWFRTEAR
jgi:hypothetical protein